MPEFEDYKDQSHSFEYIANMLSGWTYTWTGQGEPRNVNCTGISYDFSPMLGVTPYLGRLYTPEEYHVDGVQVVISHRYWKEQLGSDPHVIGRVPGWAALRQAPYRGLAGRTCRQAVSLWVMHP